MKNIVFITIVSALFFLNSCKSINEKASNTNDFYDDVPAVELPVVPLKLKGEIDRNYTVDFSKLPLHSVLIAEAEISDSSFIGAYEYKGYSLHDILNNVKISKKNITDFKPIVDLYIEVRNDKGESAFFSWGEIFYPTDKNKIIIAKSVTRIVPKKTNKLWVLPTKSKIVAGCDFFPERGIKNPSTIIVHSLNDYYEVNRTTQVKPQILKIKNNETLVKELHDFPAYMTKADMSSVFYGKGRGPHGITNFKGVFLKDVLLEYFKPDKEKIQKGMFVIAGIDGYRSAFTYAEVINRNDFKEFVIIDKDNYENAGKFSLFAPPDFFSDRAIKSISEIKFYLIE